MEELNTQTLAKTLQSVDTIRDGVISKIKNENAYILRNLSRLTSALNYLNEYKSNNTIPDKRNVDKQIARVVACLDTFARRHQSNLNELARAGGAI